MTFKEQRTLREMMGLCTNCGCMKSDPRWKWCEKCRDKERDKRITKLYEKFEVIPLPDERIVPSDHKCWTCAYSKFLGDRFFCPFAEGTCIKEGTI